MEPAAIKPFQPGQKKPKNPKRKQFQHSAEIVYTKGASIKTIASLSKVLSGVTESVIGLQYVWEYRSPSKSVPPHYQCKLCNVIRLQNDMLAHVKGWKHNFRYIKKAHPTKVTVDEETAIKDPLVRKQIKEVAAQVEAEEGRGQLKVILKEPCEVHAFKGLRTAVAKMVPPAGPELAPGMRSGMRPQGGRFPQSTFPEEYPSRGGSFHDFPMDMYEEQGVGGWHRQDFPRPDMGPRRFSEDMGPRRFSEDMGPRRFSEDMGLPQSEDDFGPQNERGGYGMDGLVGNTTGRRYSDEFMGNHMEESNRSVDMDKPGLMGEHPDNNSLPATLLSYLDTFRIENENDAQIVLKVTQKLTDVLMEYRLRSVNAGASSSPLRSIGGYASSKRHSSGDRYSDSHTGSLRYSDRPSRFYN